jgi:hypothetical protein
MSSDFVRLTRELDFVFAEISELEGRGPHFKIWHRWQEPGTNCWPGEEIVMVCLVIDGREFQLRLSATSFLIFDYLCTHRHLPQSASEIAFGLNTEPFYRQHASNAGHDPKRRAPIRRSVIKTYISRIRCALEIVFTEAGLQLDPCAVLISETTDTNLVKYRIRAIVEVVHSK